MKVEVEFKTEYLYCPTCNKTVKAYFIRLDREHWIMINTHEHYLNMGICPKTVWMTLDLKEDLHPKLKEVFRLMEQGKVEEALKLLRMEAECRM